FFSSRRRHTRFSRDWSSDVCSSDLRILPDLPADAALRQRRWRWMLQPITVMAILKIGRYIAITMEPTMPPMITMMKGSIRLLIRSEEHTSELQSRENLVCCLPLEK